MISGALLVCLIVGFSAGVPVRRQNGDGKFGYEYDVKHPGGNSRVHVRAGGEGHSGDHISEATYINPHYVEPRHPHNSYGQYPTHYDGGAPTRGYIGEKVPVYEEHSRYPEPAYLSSHKPYGQTFQSNGPFYDKPAYSGPQFVQQAAVDDSQIGHPKIEQVHVEPTIHLVPHKVEQIAQEPEVVEQSHVQLPLKDDNPVVIPNPPLDQQVLVDEPVVIFQEPVLAQLSEDVPPPKVIVAEPEPPIVQQSSVEVAPPTSDVQYMDDDVIMQLPVDQKPSVKTVVEPPVVQQVVDDGPSTFHADAPQKYEFVPFGPPYERISHSTEIIHGPPRNGPLTQQQEHIEVPLEAPSVKLPSPPVTKSVVPAELPPVQQVEEVPFAENPPPGIKTVVAQEHLDVPLTKSPPSIKSIGYAQKPVEGPFTKNVPSVKLPPPVTKSVPPPVSPYVQEPVFVKYPPRSHSVKLPPPLPSYKPFRPQPYKPVGASIKTPYFKRPPVSSYNPHSVKQPPYASSYYRKSPVVSQPPLSYVPVAKSPVPYSVKRPYLPPPPPPPVSSYPSSHYGNPHVKSPYYKAPVTKTSPIVYGVKQPVVYNTYPVKHPQPVASIKDYPSIKSPPPPPPLAQSPYGEGPILVSSPVPSSVKHPQHVVPVKGYPSIKSPSTLAQTSYVEKPLFESPPSVKTVPSVKGYPSVKSPPLTQSSYGEEPILESPPSVKTVPSVKGYPGVKSPPLTQSSYGEEPILESPPSVKTVPSVKGYPSVKSPPVAQSSYADEPLLESPPVSSVKGYPNVKSPPAYGDGPLSVSSPQKKYLPVGHAFDGPKDELELGPPPVVSHSVEEASPLEKYPQPSHAFQISPGPKPVDKVPEPSPLDKYRQVSHAVQLNPVLKPTPTPNLFAAVPAPGDEAHEDDDAKSSLESPPPPAVSHAVLLPKVSALRSDPLSVPGPRHRGRFEESGPRQDFPAFPVESAYKYPDPVSDHVSNSFGGRSRYEPEESESIGEARLEVDRVHKDIGLSFGDRIPSRSRL